MASPRHGHGTYFLWVGRIGTGFDLSERQAEALIITKTFETQPLEQVTHTLKTYNIQQHSCGIWQISTQLYQPITDPLAYCMLFNESSIVTKWCATAEYNSDGIFHVHVVFRSISRPDAIKRSYLTHFEKLKTTSCFLNKYGQDGIMECVKIQRCHKPEGILQYMMKNPVWITSNDEKYLQCLSDIVVHNLHARFITPVEPENDPPKMNPMAEELVNVIIEHQCKTLEDTVRVAPQIVCKYLHKPGFTQIVNNCLTYVKETAANFTLQHYEKYDPNPEQIHQILLHQGISPYEFDSIFHSWITKKDSKRNTICLHGPSNTGKTAFFQGLKQCVAWGEIVNSTQFAFEGITQGYIAFWEEPYCAPELAEKAKQVLEGQTCLISVKFRKPHRLERHPVAITTNHDLWRFCNSEKDAFCNRMWIFPWREQVQNTYYLPRISEHRCKCRYCQASSGGQTTTDSTSTDPMQTRDESISTREHSPRTIESSHVGTRSLSPTGTGPCGSKPSTSTDNEQTNPSEHRSSTSTSIIRYFKPKHTSRSTDDDPGECSSKSIITKSMVPKQHRKHNERNMGSNDGDSTSRNIRSGDNGGIRSNTSHDNNSRSLVTTHGSSNKPKIHSGSKKQRLDKSLGAKVGAIKLDLNIPSQNNWQEYLSWLFHIHG
nr:MAG: nonstructural protein 1 [Protoparvovirus sp.]